MTDIQIKKYITAINKKEKVKGIYLYGSFGIGKTHSMKKILDSIYEEIKVGEELIKIKITKELIVWPEYISNLKERMNGTNIDITPINELKKYRVLVIDDIGGEIPSTWALSEMLFPILNYRIDNRLATFFTSNLSIKELKTYYLKRSDSTTVNRVIDRIYGLTKEIKMTGINHRHEQEG